MSEIETRREKDATTEKYIKTPLPLATSVQAGFYLDSEASVLPSPSIQVTIRYDR